MSYNRLQSQQPTNLEWFYQQYIDWIGLGCPINKNVIRLKLIANSSTQLDSLTHIENLPNLKYLNVQGNNLTEITSGIGQLKKLETLLIGSNKISQLPDEIGNCKQLKSLTISRNNFKTLPKDIESCKNLTWLDCSNNQFESIPVEVSTLYNLETVIFNNNLISDIPDGFFDNCINLYSLELYRNKLTKIPDISNIETLEFFTINGNNIENLPNTIGSMLKNE